MFDNNYLRKGERWILKEASRVSNYPTWWWWLIHSDNNRSNSLTVDIHAVLTPYCSFQPRCCVHRKLSGRRETAAVTPNPSRLRPTSFFFFPEFSLSLTLLEETCLSDFFFFLFFHLWLLRPTRLLIWWTREAPYSPLPQSLPGHSSHQEELSPPTPRNYCHKIKQSPNRTGSSLFLPVLRCLSSFIYPFTKHFLSLALLPGAELDMKM